MTKTTFHLDEELLARLKVTAAHHDSTVRELLIEGANMILDKYEGLTDRAGLHKRAAKARSRLRSGLFTGTQSSLAAIDVRHAAEPMAKHGKSRSR